jgi:hypothetical protein
VKKLARGKEVVPQVQGKQGTVVVLLLEDQRAICSSGDNRWTEFTQAAASPDSMIELK